MIPPGYKSDEKDVMSTYRSETRRYADQHDKPRDNKPKADRGERGNAGLTSREAMHTGEGESSSYR